MFRFNYDAGHYTQVVWAETEEIGCGFTYYSVRLSHQYDIASGFEIHYWIILHIKIFKEPVGPFLAYKSLTICNYAKGGNAAGKAMYKIGTACDECDTGYSCEDSLCAAWYIHLKYVFH